MVVVNDEMETLRGRKVMRLFLLRGCNQGKMRVPAKLPRWFRQLERGSFLVRIDGKVEWKSRDEVVEVEIEVENKVLPVPSSGGSRVKREL